MTAWGTRLLVGLTSIALIAGTGGVAGAQEAGPALATPTATLAAALKCSDDLATAGKTPILLVPGTIETAAEAYSWGYQRVLRAKGNPVCTVVLPERGTIDMQTTVEYVVFALRKMNSVSGRKVSAIGHSQGGMLLGWAMRFWPDLPSKVDDVISLSSPFHGSDLVNTVLCPGASCPEVAWQIKTGSQWSQAVTRAPLPTGLAFTSIGSHSDELVWPAPIATRMPGATNLMVQDLCWLRPVGHVSILSDAAAYAIVTDALENPGPANLGRVSRVHCLFPMYDGIDLLGMSQLLGTGAAIVEKLLTTPYVSAEPALRAYAR